jgi:hypothetical protein
MTWLLVAVTVLASGCATLPHEPVQRALFQDLRKSVELSDSSGWYVDKSQLQSNAEDILRSVCQVDAAKRDDLDAWLSGQIALHGGSAQRVWLEHGRDLDAADDVLALERTRLFLRYGSEHAAEDCPFWLTPRDDFKGVQSDADRWVLLAETTGYGSIVLQGDNAAIGGGGGGRLLFAHGVGSQYTLALGGEVGGVGAFVENDKGGRSLDTTFVAGVPLLFRWLRYSRILDFELAPMLRLNPGESVLPPGFRASVGAGLATMRASSFMPYAILWAGYEFHPANHGNPADHSLHVGTRVGIDWDP